MPPQTDLGCPIRLTEIEALRAMAFDRGERRDWMAYTGKRAIYRDYTLKRFAEIETADSDESGYQ